MVRLKVSEEWASEEDGITFVLPHRGTGTCVSGSVTHQFGAGDVLVLKKDGGTLRGSSRGEIVFGCFSVRLEHLFPLFAANELCLLQHVTDEFKNSKLYPASGTLAGECHRLLSDAPSRFDLDHRSQLLRVVAAILSVELKNLNHLQSGGDFVHTKMFEKLSKDELLRMSAGQLASKFSCSRRHLNRLFHQHFGYSVGGLKMELRLLKAASLLRDLDAKVISVAERSGFTHLGLFNTCFKRRFGTSPGVWRKLNRGGLAPQQPSADNFQSQLLRNGSSLLTDSTEALDGPRTSAAPTRNTDATVRFVITARSDRSPVVRNLAPTVNTHDNGLRSQPLRMCA